MDVLRAGWCDERGDGCTSDARRREKRSWFVRRDATDPLSKLFYFFVMLPFVCFCSLTLFLRTSRHTPTLVATTARTK